MVISQRSQYGWRLTASLDLLTAGRFTRTGSLGYSRFTGSYSSEMRDTTGQQILRPRSETGGSSNGAGLMSGIRVRLLDLSPDVSVSVEAMAHGVAIRPPAKEATVSFSTSALEGGSDSVFEVWEIQDVHCVLPQPVILPEFPPSCTTHTILGHAFHTSPASIEDDPLPGWKVSKHSRWAMSKSLASLEVLALQKQINDLKEAAVAQRRVEMALRDAADFARAALDDSPIPLCKLTGDGKVAYANEAMVGFLGYASRKDLLDLVPILGILLDGQDLTGLCRALPEPPAFVETTGIFRRKDGSARPGHLRLRRGTQKSDFTLAIVNEAPRL